MNFHSKIIYSLERLSDAFKVLLWEKAKEQGVSPIQIQILLFVESHKKDWCNVSQLAKEFNVTKPTVSDAVKVLCKKGFLEKDYSSADSRSYTLFTTAVGKELIEKIEAYTSPLETILQGTDINQLESLYVTTTELIHKLNTQGVIQVQRLCFGCRFYRKLETGHFCNLLESDLKEVDIRLDCSEFEQR